MVRSPLALTLHAADATDEATCAGSRAKVAPDKLVVGADCDGDGDGDGDGGGGEDEDEDANGTGGTCCCCSGVVRCSVDAPGPSSNGLIGTCPCCCCRTVAAAAAATGAPVPLGWVMLVLCSSCSLPCTPCCLSAARAWWPYVACPPASCDAHVTVATAPPSALFLALRDLHDVRGVGVAIMHGCGRLQCRGKASGCEFIFRFFFPLVSVLGIFFSVFLALCPFFWFLSLFLCEFYFLFFFFVHAAGGIVLCPAAPQFKPPENEVSPITILA